MSMSEAAGTLARVIAVRSPARGVVLIVAASGFFAVNGSVAKLVIQAGIGPAHLTTLRASGAFLALLGGVLVHDARRLAVLLAVYFVVGARGVADRDPLSLNCWAFGVAALAGAIARPWWGFPFGVLDNTKAGVPVWLLCCYVVLLGSVVPYVLVAASLQHLPATSVGILGMIEPVIAATVAWLALDEVLSPAQLLGGMLVLAGVALAETARVAAPEPPHLPPG